MQRPYLNRFETIWEYKEAFLSDRIDFFSYVGPVCPICNRRDCYRKITPYYRYAIDLFPGFRKERIPVARFLCRTRGKTFSLLAVQLIPYFQYTVSAVIGTLILGLKCWQAGYKGFFGASIGVDSDSLLTPWLIACWLKAVLLGCRRAHPVIGRFYNLDHIRISERTGPWKELEGYFQSFGFTPLKFPILPVLKRYSRATNQFLFGKSSRQRRGNRT